MNGDTLTDQKDKLMQLYAAMTPERLLEHTRYTMDSAYQNGQADEREEIVCRLLASGMPVEEIAVVLCKRVAEIELIQSNNASIAIPKYMKKLAERRKRREKQAK